MNQSPNITAIVKALTAAQKEFATAKKDSTNPHFKSKYADLGSVWDAVSGPLAKHDLCLTQGVESQDKDGLNLATTLYHGPSGEWLGNLVCIPVASHTAQAVGSALTYGRRYGMAALLGIVADEDDDGNAASAKPTPQAPPKPEGPTLPFGKSKGKLLKAMSDEDLSNALKWASDNAKYEEFQKQATEELESRRE